MPTIQKRILQWGAIISALLLILAAGYMLYSKEKNGSMNSSMKDHAQSVAASVLGLENKPTLDDVEVSVQGSTVDVVLLTSHFAWAPDRVGKANIQGEGHAHLVIDNGKDRITMVGSRYEFQNVKPGKHVIVAELAENNHTPYPDQKKTVPFEITK